MAVTKWNRANQLKKLDLILNCLRGQQERYLRFFHSPYYLVIEAILDEISKDDAILIAQLALKIASQKKK